ncbi:hypothetical protein RND71_025308 [Anisodus tanguticus]|uniref:rhamnogalacturonan endolyase n=1 Tax=Anisodus tanguticus TaxID=243964 RepID=A0AAE1RS16_9SOLA|nr:hypothetical protein RND71_025308 [Anisodus tanguticus]
MTNGFTNVTLSKPDGNVIGISYGGIENLLETKNAETNRGFHYMAVSDERQRVMPTEVDRKTGQVLDYKEAVFLTNPTNPNLKGEVDDKYFYANNNEDDKVYGWVGANPPVGFWMINPSNEFRTAGPIRQDLTTHVGPTVLSVFVSTHYAGEDLAIKFQHGEPWKKVIGPVFVYINSDPSAKANPSILWNDAKKRGYQFWTKTNSSGNFIIENIIPGKYNLYATVPGYIGDYRYTSDVQVTPGSNIELGSLVYKPPRNGATLWEIGVPDRTASEFFIPSPPPQYKVHKYQNDTESKNVGNNTYKATTWKIIFNLANVDNASNYTLQLALAAAHEAELQVRVNDEKAREPRFTTGFIGGSNAIARHGIHGLYFLYSIGFQGNLLVKGTNTIFLTQIVSLSPFQGVMYDYLRLEGPHQ